MQGYENGFIWAAGCLFDNVTRDMRIYKGRNLRPGALGGARPNDYNEALSLPFRPRLWQMAFAILHPRRRRRGGISAAKVNVGMVGINRADPGAPSPYYTFGGWKKNPASAILQPARAGFRIRFYTKTKTVTARWPSGVKEGAGVLDFRP